MDSAYNSIRNRIRDIIEWMTAQEIIQIDYRTELGGYLQDYDDVTGIWEAPDAETHRNYIELLENLNELVEEIREQHEDGPELLVNMAFEYQNLSGILIEYITAMYLEYNEKNLKAFIRHAANTMVQQARLIGRQDSLVDAYGGNEYFERSLERCDELYEFSFITSGRSIDTTRNFLNIPAIIDDLDRLASIGSLSEDYYLIESLKFMLMAISECFDIFYHDFYQFYTSETRHQARNARGFPRFPR